MRKNISAYTKINRRIYASLSAHIRLFGILPSPVVWCGKCGAKEHYHLDKSDRPRTVIHRWWGSPWTICLVEAGCAYGYFSVPSSRPTLMKAAMALSR